MLKPVLMTRLKNEINKKKPGMSIYLKNISINKVKKGCSGFVQNPTNGSIVYVTTEESTVGPEKFMCRYADHLKDYRGYHNRWTTGTEELVAEICHMLDYLPAEVNEHRF